MAHDRGGFDGFTTLGRIGGGWGAHRGEFGRLGLFGFGFFDTEKTQERFETRFESLQTQYNEGVATGDDYFSTDDYTRVLDKTEALDDRYGLFVSGVERSISRLDDIISLAQDDVTYFNDLLADYRADDSLSEARLARIEAFINRITDRLNSKIDTLTEKQTTLQTNLPTYQSFQTKISTFLADITAASGGAASAASSSKSLTNLASFLLSADSDDGAECAATSISLTPNGVPEPAAGMLVMIATSVALFARRGRR